MRPLIILPLIFFIVSNSTFGQSYKEWDKHDVVKFYAKKVFELDYDWLDENGDDIYNREIVYYAPTRVDDGVYEVEVGDNPSSSLWQIKGTNIYMKFRYIPYLYRWDEGILEVSYGSGVFYEKD
jgi:hypothetical protein